MSQQHEPVWRLFLIPLAIAGGCETRPARLEHTGPDWKPAEVAKATLAAFDADGDGLLSGAELAKSPGWNAAVKRVDRSLDGQLSEAEITARISFYRDCRKTLVKTVAVALDGDRPKSGISLRFVPETGMENTVGVSTGKTDAKGQAVMRSEGSADAGLPPGVYRVEAVGPSGETSVVGGYEAAPDGGVANLTPRFELSRK